MFLFAHHIAEVEGALGQVEPPAEAAGAGRCTFLYMRREQQQWVPFTALEEEGPEVCGEGSISEPHVFLSLSPPVPALMPVLSQGGRLRPGGKIGSHECFHVGKAEQSQFLTLPHRRVLRF